VTKGVVLMAYGTPRTLDDVEAYYTHIRGGRKPSEEALADLIARYKAIGGTSPLIEITERQTQDLERALRKAGSETGVYAAMKHSPPFIADVVRQASEDGVDRMLTIALAPHYSRISIGSYISTVNAASEALPTRMKVESVESWFDNPLLVRAWRDRVKEAAARRGKKGGLSSLRTASRPESSRKETPTATSSWRHLALSPTARDTKNGASPSRARARQGSLGWAQTS